MDSQTQTQLFLNHVLKFFGSGEEVATPDKKSHDMGTVDLPEVVGVLRSAGFILKYTDKSDYGGSSKGCRVVVMCKRSGTRVVLDGDGPCTCQSEEAMKALLEAARTESNVVSRPSSPTPSTRGLLEDSSLNTSMREKDPDVTVLTRQRTWCRDDEGTNSSVLQEHVSMPESRRVSAPPAPVQSAWATLQGDELNVVAATDLLQEAILLLSGVKKANLRNTPVGPSRRLSATAMRRLSSDQFAMPVRSLSRTWSASSGLATSAETLSSPASLQSNYGLKPQPVVKPRLGMGATLRRSVSAVGPSPKVPASAVMKNMKPDTKPKAEAIKKSTAAETKPSTTGPKIPSLLKAPSSYRNGALTRSSLKVEIKSSSPSSGKAPAAVSTNLSSPITEAKIL